MLFSPFVPQLKISNNKSIPIFSYPSETRWQNGDGNYTSAVENRIVNMIHQNIMIQKAQRESFPLVSAQHLRYRRNIKGSSENVTKFTHCENFTFVIKYEDRYEVWNNFSIENKGKIYPYNTYRVMNDGLYVCNSSDDLIQQRWRNITVQQKHRIPYKHCRVSVDSFYRESYTLFKDFNVFFKPTNQNFTREDYGVISGYFSICSAKLSLSCNDYLLKVKYSEQYNVLNDFSLIYNNRKYDYREYRINNNMIEMCASNHSTVLHIWKNRNSLEKSGFLRLFRCTIRFKLYKRHYTVSKHLTVYFSPTNQYFTTHDYDVLNGELVVCLEKFKPTSLQYTKEDLLMCNDSIINIEYDDEYKVWNNFSILYKNKIYRYTEYRALNNSLKICNSTDNFVKTVWELRNYWLMATRLSKSCDFYYSTITNSDYIVNKQLTIYYSGSSQYFTRHDYDVENGTPYVCKKTLRPDLNEYNQKDLLMCNDSIINIKYDDEYNVWDNFSIFYKKKMYSYTEYRALNDGIKICNSTDNFVKNVWELRNNWVIGKKHSKSCNFNNWKLKKSYYSINKQLTVYESGTSQYFTRYDYDVIEGEAVVCTEIVRPDSYQYTKEDLLMCNDSKISIKYDDEYKVWNNLSILYKNKIYSYTEYRALNDSIKICNSSDNFVKNNWHLRNKWIKEERHVKSCRSSNKRLRKPYYTINKQFTVYESGTSQYFTRHDYDVIDGTPVVCYKIARPNSFQYTKEDLLMCNNSIINIKYDDEYKIWNNFSILYKNKMYSYTEYRALNDSIKICNSTDNFVKNNWKLRNKWIKEERHVKSCRSSNKRLRKPYYTINKQFTVYESGTSQYFTRHDYDVIDGTPVVCYKIARPNSFQYTKDDLLMCNNSIINIKYDDEYKIWNNFSILYKNKMYSYTEYRALNDSIKICNSTDKFVKNIWQLRNKWIKGERHVKRCRSSNWKIPKPYYSINKQFTVYESGTSQYFTRHDYDVIEGELVVCTEIVRPDSYQFTEEDLLMCNDSIINIKYVVEYKVWNNFTVLYKKKLYSYTEYRALNDSIKICNSTNNFVKNVWELRNHWIMKTRHLKSCNLEYSRFKKTFYSINKELTVYESGKSQYFKKHNYSVSDGELVICEEILRPNSYQYTQEDLLMCKDSIINVKYDDDYKVWNNFSLRYKNKMYSYTEYRVLNDSIKICNSSDNFVKNSWKLRNKWVKGERHVKSCPSNNWRLRKPYYSINKQFTVYESGTSQYFTRYDYDVIDGRPVVCFNIVRPKSFQYTKEDLIMCNDSIINIKYDDDYKVWNNFSLLYKNKMYSYTEYRVLNDSIKICNSNDNFVKNSWKLRNKWVKGERHVKSCPSNNWRLRKPYYSIKKQFTVYESGTSQYFTRYDYDVIDGRPVVCFNIVRPNSFQYTKEDLIMCNDSIINIKYDDEYKLWNNFSMLYKNKMYSYTEYRALNDSIKICNSTDNFVKNTWNLRNKWVMELRHLKSCNFRYNTINRPYYSINKQFTVYESGTSQYFTKHNYGVSDGELVICKKILRPNSFQYTKKDLVMCNDSIVNIKYDDEYKVWNNFSLLYKKNLYSYTEYRALNDGIKICNSTDDFVKNIWKLRNYWVMVFKIFNSCNKPDVRFPVYQGEYDAMKDLTVVIRANKFSIGKDDYAIFNGIPFICVNKCVNSTSTINYEDEYKVWSNFTVMYKGKMYNYFEYRVTDNGLQICNSSDRLIKEKWRNLTALEKRSTAYADCNVHVGGFYHENYTVYKNFSVFFKPTNQKFTRQDYGVISNYFAICSASLSFSCNESLLEVQCGEQYKVFKNFSLFYERKMFDHSEYRFSRNGVKICTSNNVKVQAIWRTQNKWEKSLGAPCDRSYKLNAKEYTVTKTFSIHSNDDGQVFNRYEYSIIDASPYVCKVTAKPNYKIADVNISVVPLFALALSSICLVFLFMVYCLLPQLRTLPGLNLMSLCFAFLLWQIYLVVFLSKYSHVGKLSAIQCERLFLITKFITYSIVMNAAVNIYHLRQTFCGIRPVNSEKLNKRTKFVKYSFFSWGVPVAVAIVYIVLVKTKALQFNQHATSWKADVQSSLRFNQCIELDNEDTKGFVLKVDAHTKISVKKNVAPYVSPAQNFQDEWKPNISINEDELQGKSFYKRIVLGNENNNARIYQHVTGDCINGRITPGWTTAVDVYCIQGGIMLYIVVAFILTAYQIHHKLKAGKRIGQKSNVVKHRKFVQLLTLSTTTALSYWFPLFLSEMIDFDFDVKIALYTVTLLTGAYIGIAFGFTRRNYQLLKKKNFPAKERLFKNRVAAIEYEPKKNSAPEQISK